MRGVCYFTGQAISQTSSSGAALKKSVKYTSRGLPRSPVREKEPMPRLPHMPSTVPKFRRLRFGSRKPDKGFAVGRYVPYLPTGRRRRRIVHGDDRRRDLDRHRPIRRISIVDHDEHRLRSKLATIRIRLDIGAGGATTVYRHLSNPRHGSRKPRFQLVLPLDGAFGRHYLPGNVTHLNIEHDKKSFLGFGTSRCSILIMKHRVHPSGLSRLTCWAAAAEMSRLRST